MFYILFCLFFSGVVSAQAGEISADALHNDSLGVLHAEGSVKLELDELRIEADRLHLDLDAKTGEMYDAKISFQTGQTLKGAYLQRLDIERFQGDNILYSACPEDDMAWYLTAEHATLDQESGTFIAQNAWLNFGGVPVWYAPRWQHALSRRSGFLMPTLAQGSRRGLEISLPIYWAASPAWDMTFTPRWMDLRGTMADVEWRHRSPLGTEAIQIQSVFDRQEQAQRSRVQSDMAWVWDAHWGADMHADWVSDGLFVADFPREAELESLAYVTSQTSLHWTDIGHNVILSSQYQQRLGDVSNASTLQILPRLQSTHQWDFLDEQRIYLQQQTTMFRRDVGQAGLRVGLKPEWAMAQQWLGGAVASTWAVSGLYVGYDTQQADSALGGNATSSYSALASSLEIEIAVERLSENKQWRHEIKPILRLDVSAAPQQEGAPLYDSALAPLSMGNLLYGNRYSGWDRFERMQRLSMLIASSLQQKSEGGSRIVFEAKLGVAWDGLRESVDTNAVANPVRSQSNVLAELAWLPTSAWRLAVGGQHDPDVADWVETHANASWAAAASQDGAAQYVSASWQKTTASHSIEAESLQVSGRMNFSPRWSSQLRSQYDVLRKQVLQTSAGVSYVHPCWDMALEVFQSYQIGSDRLSDMGARLLLAFDGLGSIAD